MTDWLTRGIGRLYGHRQGILLLVHSVLIVVANQAAFWLRFDGEVPATQQPYDTVLLPLVLLVRLGVFVPLRLHQGVWRYASIWDLRAIVFAVSISSVVLWAITHGILGITVYPRSVFIIDAVLLIVLMGGVRMARRIYDVSGSRAGGKRVIVYGAGDAGELIVREMLQDPTMRWNPLGFVDDNPHRVGLRIHGIPVIGGRDRLAEIIQTLRPEEILIAIPAASQKELRSIVRALEPYKIRLTTLPRLKELSGNRINVGQIRQLRLEDLLARDKVGLDREPVMQFLDGKRVLVTGAGGSIGAELCRQIVMAKPASLALLERYENGLFDIHGELKNAAPGVALHPVVADVTDECRIRQTFDSLRPQVIFHAAAHKHVPLMEANPCEAVKNNVRGTRLVAEAALRVNAERFVLISSDKAVSPASVMGGTKRVAELIVNHLNRGDSTRFAAVRFGNVLGSSGSVVPTFVNQIAKGGPVTVTHPEMRRFFMLIPEAVQLVLHAAALKDPAPLLVLDMGEPVKVTDLARDLIRLSGYVPDQEIAIQFTGIRPGEKLVEELIGDGEIAEPSGLDKVLRVSSDAAPASTGLSAALTALEQFALDGRPDETRRALNDVLMRFCMAGARSAIN
jgi:FlaA1/EpsC-like NDP-sugar epimerase